MEQTPVLVVIFNRPDKVSALMASLAKVRPTRLFVSADGPRPHVATDAERCAESRRIAQNVTWPCEVLTNFSDANLGVDPAVEGAINWFFQNVDRGIILEDDCIPHPDFFRFASEMLERYSENERVMMVSGNNFQNGQRRGGASYYFSRYPNTWGWATWRRAWRRYDTSLSALPAFTAENRIRNIRPRRDEQRQWLRHFESLRAGIRTPWDAKWVFALWNHDGLSITPNVNLVQNIGFGEDSTHTRSVDAQMDATAESIGAITHPSSVEADESADSYLFDTIYKATFLRKLRYAWHAYVLSRIGL